MVTRRAVPDVLREMFGRQNRFITLIAVLAALGGLLFGYDTGVVGGAAPYIKKSLGIGSFGESWVVGSLLLGAIVGAFLSGKLADLLSRKWTKFVAGIIYTAAALGSAFAPTVETLCAAGSCWASRWERRRSWRRCTSPSIPRSGCGAA
jgi:MFS family permease